MQNDIKEFIGLMKVTPPEAKCDPLLIYGHWTLKHNGKRWVWCDKGLYKHGINIDICEIVKIDEYPT